MTFTYWYILHILHIIYITPRQFDTGLSIWFYCLWRVRERGNNSILDTFLWMKQHTISNSIVHRCDLIAFDVVRKHYLTNSFLNKNIIQQFFILINSIVKYSILFYSSIFEKEIELMAWNKKQLGWVEMAGWLYIYCSGMIMNDERWACS